MAWTYLESGADSLTSLTDNVSAFDAYRLRQQSLRGVTVPDMARSMLGTPLDLPVGLAPTGIQGLAHWRGDVASARGAERAGTRMALSTGSVYTIEEVAEATEQQHWFQLYAIGDRDLVGSLMQRAKDAGYSALILTVDTTVPGNRIGEQRTGMGRPLHLTPRRALDIAFHPRWMINLLRHKRVMPVNFDVAGLKLSSQRTLASAAEAVDRQLRYMGLDLNWDDVAWIRENWKGPLYIKGILDPDDAEHAICKIGAQGVIVSNHGGRQLDEVPATLHAMRHIIDRVGGFGEVYLDGGIRKGSDAVKALCLGAHGVFLGRAFLYGLAAAGQEGVEHVVHLFRQEMQRALTLMGCATINELDRNWLLARDANRVE
jgi:L-lactate dehydrogenase (cytochrome)/(S)-mandelate dehydrogenase